MIDKTGDVARAEELLRELREKERLQRAKGDVMFRLQTAMDSGQIDVLEHMIKGEKKIKGLLSSKSFLSKFYWFILIRLSEQSSEC